MFGTEKITRTDNKITLFNTRFNLNACKNLSKRELDALSNTASNSFILSKLLAISSNYMWYIQLYFYDNLFYSNENSKMQDKARLGKETIETLLNELFVLDNQETNETVIRQYAEIKNITVI